MFRLIRCGYNVVHPEGIVIDRPHGSGDYLFLFFRSRMHVETEHERYVTDKNTCIIYRKGSRQYYREVEQPMAHDWFHFDGDDVEDFCRKLNLPLDTPMKVHEPVYVSRKVSEIQEAQVRNGLYRDEIIDATVRCLLMKLSDIRNRIGPNKPVGKYYDPLVSLRNEIYNNPSVSWSIGELAASVNMSRSYFQKLYKELFGISVMNDIIHNRLEYAMYRLKNTSDSIRDIAAQCGYENDVHFMRQFKKFIGLTPSEFRSGSMRAGRRSRAGGTMRA
jgi:AraC family transcriptional regulator of arabinose operon